MHAGDVGLCGGGGIRTHGTRKEPTSFQDLRLRPLGHASGAKFAMALRAQMREPAVRRWRLTAVTEEGDVRGFRPTVLVVLVLVLAGCGARTGNEAGRDTRLTSPDLTTPSDDATTGLPVIPPATAPPATDPSLADDGDIAVEEPAPVDTSSPEELAWRRLAITQGSLRGAAGAAVEDQESLDKAWQQYGFSGRAPALNFKTRFMLFLAQPDDACEDELIRLRFDDELLKPTWLPPPGMCAQPLIMRVHAVDMHRAYPPARFTVAEQDPHFTDETEPVTIRVRTIPGPPPPVPQPRRAMTADELDEVFAGHPVRRCGNENPYLDGDAHDPEQERQAETVMEKVRSWMQRHDYRPDVDYVPFISRTRGVRAGVLVDDGNGPEVRRQLDRAFGEGSIHVVDHPYDFQAVRKAQNAVGSLPQGDRPGQIMWTTGIPGPVEIGMVDPTREALDRIADTVNPHLVCVTPELSGQR